MNDLESRLDHARKIADEAGKITLKYFQTASFEVERKADRSPVTVADREAETYLRNAIDQAFPADGVIGEEFGETAGTSGYRWILDPIDGTKSFISGVPLYGTLVGVERDGVGVAGVIQCAGLNELVFAARGLGAWYQRRGEAPIPTRVSNKSDLDDSIFVTTQVDTFAERGDAHVFDQLQQQCYITRTWGDCYGYLLVATGRADMMLDPILNVWDAAAVQPVIEEAGGVFTDWNGIPTIHAGEAIGTNEALLEKFLSIRGSGDTQE